MTLLPALGKAPQLLPAPVRSDDGFDLQVVETVGGLRSLCQRIAPTTEQRKQGRWASVRRLEQTKVCCHPAFYNWLRRIANLYVVLKSRIYFSVSLRRDMPETMATNSKLAIQP